MVIALVDFELPSAKEFFVKSIHETGFSVIKNHGIDKKLIEKVFKQWEVFFSGSEQNKKKYLFHRDFPRVQSGFFPQEVSERAKGVKAKDLKEFFHYYPCVKEHSSFIGRETQELRSQLISLAKTLLVYLEEALPEGIKKQMSQPLSCMIDEEYNTLLRVLHYPPLEEKRENGSIRAAAHEDINLITLLISPSAPGLQALDKESVWQDVPCEENCITVNIADMLQECSNGFYQSTKHRVINLENSFGNKSRYSIPLFLHPRDEVVLSKRYTAKEYRMERINELGLL